MEHVALGKIRFIQMLLRATKNSLMIRKQFCFHYVNSKLTMTHLRWSRDCSHDNKFMFVSFNRDSSSFVQSKTLQFYPSVRNTFAIDSAHVSTIALW